MRAIYLFIYLFISCSVFAQLNLVPNAGFENYSSCPDGTQWPNEINLAAPWYNPTGCSPDYFNACSTGGVFEIPNNNWGFQVAHAGSAYIGIGTFGGTSSTREYIQIQLTDSLIANHYYDVKFYVSLTLNSSYKTAITELGLLFSDTAITSTGIGVLNFTPQITSPAGVYLNDTLNWMQISGTYQAIGGEKFITIGNFKNDANTDTLDMGSNAFSKQAYYYIDDVSVIDNGLAGIKSNSLLSNTKVYPNPNPGKFVIDFGDNRNTSYTINLYDLSGNLVMKDKLQINSGKSELDVQLENGMYLMRILDDTGKLYAISRVVVSR